MRFATQVDRVARVARCRTFEDYYQSVKRSDNPLSWLSIVVVVDVPSAGEWVVGQVSNKEKDWKHVAHK